MRTLNILSLDLDWFNGSGWQQAADHISSFFSDLCLNCELPSSVTLMSEHQYLYPWCRRLLLDRQADKADIVNLDEHHDFYWLEDIEDYDEHFIDCGNFFAFMAYKRILGKYTWVTTADDLSSLATARREMDGYLSVARKHVVRLVSKRAKVHSRRKVWDVLRGQKFDGFCIVKSANYVKNGPIIYEQVNQILRDKFALSNGFSVETHKCKRNFRSSKVPAMRTTKNRDAQRTLLISA